MKNFFKKLAFVMALAMVITSLAPAAGVFAAAKPALNAKSKTLLLGTKGRNSFDFNLNNKVKGSTYKWTTSNKKVVTVAQNGIVKAVGNGKATIKLAIKLPTNKTTNLTATVVVKTNATSVEVTNVPTAAIKVGETVNLNRSYKTLTGTKTTDVTSFVITSENAAKASIKANGKFTATEAGEYTIKAVMAQSASKLKAGVYTAESKEVKVVVEPSIASVEQKSSTQFVVNFDADMSKLVTKENLTITNAAGVKLPIIKEVKFDAAGKVATVNTFIELTDKEVYTVAYEKMSKDFVASVGAVASIVIAGPSTVAYNVNEKVEVAYYDANGVKVSGNNDNLSLEIISGNGWLDGQNLTLFNIGDKTVLKATYKTGTYDANWNEIVLTSPEYLVTAVESKAHTTTGVTTWTIADSNKAAKDVDYTKVVTSIPVNDTSSKSVYVKGINTDGKDVYDFTFASTDTTKLIVDPNTGALVPVATGTAGVIATSGKFKTVLTITITPEAKSANVIADTNTATVSRTIDQVATFKLTLRDQYSNKINVANTSNVKFTINSVPSAEKDFAAGFISSSVDDGYVIVKFDTATVKTDGDYSYKVEVDGKTTVLRITVRSGDNTKATSYRVVFEDNKNTTDVVINHTKTGVKTLNAKVYGYDVKGVPVIDLTTGSSLTYKLTTDSSVTGSITNGVINLNNSSRVGQYAVSGTVTIKVDGIDTVTNVVSAPFEVKNSQVKATVTQEKTKIESSSIGYKAILESNVEGTRVFNVESKTDASLTFKLGKIDTTIIDASKEGIYGVSVKTIIVTETFDNGAVSTYELTVNKTIEVVVK